MQYTGKVIGPAAYQVIDMMRLPDEVKDDMEPPGNDCAVIVNPEYWPRLKAWLEENGYNSTVCYIGWWSW